MRNCNNQYGCSIATQKAKGNYCAIFPKSLMLSHRNIMMPGEWQSALFCQGRQWEIDYWTCECGLLGIACEINDENGDGDEKGAFVSRTI